MAPAVCCVPLSVRRTSGPETLRSTAVCCVSSAVLPPVCWASSGGRSTSLGHVAQGGVSVQAPPSASPPLLPSLVAPLPLPPLYFYSLNSTESPAFYHLHTHTHTHIYTRTPHTHIPTHTATHRHLHTHTSIPTHAHTHTPLSGKAQPWGVRARGPHCSGSDAHSASPTALCHPLLAFPFRGGAWG